MFEFWNDLLNDKQTFLYTVLIPTCMALVVYFLSRMLQIEEIENLKDDVSELKKRVFDNRGKEGE